MMMASQQGVRVSGVLAPLRNTEEIATWSSRVGRSSDRVRETVEVVWWRRHNKGLSQSFRGSCATQKHQEEASGSYRVGGCGGGVRETVKVAWWRR